MYDNSDQKELDMQAGREQWSDKENHNKSNYEWQRELKLESKEQWSNKQKAKVKTYDNGDEVDPRLQSKQELKR